ncbi:hypothetical protein C0992_009955 [Termitomyces sp. T32_za158]|nr:hypothetical protein C0992_009955 [Termitomyces sp. T32_za158]
MESPATPTIPRLRLTRNPHALERFLSSSLLPEPAGVLDDDNDRDDDQESTPKVSSTALLDATGTPAARLRALLALSPASSKSTPKPPSRSSDIDSDFEPLNASYGSTPSVARESLKGIFSRAMRDPGNTPQKGKFKARRNSIDTSEVDASPRVERQRNENKGKMKSLSDEETDPAKTSETSFRSSQAATFDILRERLINSHSQLKDLRLPDSTYHSSNPDDDNEAMQFSRATDITTTTPPVATSTPQQSLHMFIDSHFPSQSNLLDRNSEMQRAFEGFDSSDTEGASQRPAVSFQRSLASAHQTQKPQSSQLTLKSLLSRETSDSSHALAADAKGQHETPRFGNSRLIGGGDHKADDLSLEEDLVSSRTPTQARVPDVSRQSLHMQSSPSGPSVGQSSSRNALEQRDFDGFSSKGSSLGSQADVQEKAAELKKERKFERERDWQKPRSSRLDLTSTAERNRTRDLIHTDSMSLVPTGTFRRHSPAASSRASSPAGSLVSSHDDDNDIVHEREKKWNARPKWAHGPPRPVSPSKTQPPDPVIIEDSSTKSATRKGESPQRQRSHNKSRSRNDSTASVQATSAPRPDPSPQSPTHDHTHSRKLQTNGTTLSRSPSPSTMKGKGRAINQGPFLETDTASLDSSHPERVSFSTMKSGLGPNSGFSFVKKRAPLEPIELETGNFGQKARKDLTSLSTRSKASAKSDSISIKSPQNLDLSDHSIRSTSPAQNISSQSESPSVSDTHSKPLFIDVTSMIHKDEDEPSETLEYIQPRSSSRLQLSNGNLEQSVSDLQQKLNSNSSETATQEPEELEEYSPLPSPPRDSRIKHMSPLLTPPRRPSTSQVEFKTPSPPRNMPDLPGPPTSSESEVEEESTRAPFSHLRSDLTAMKTPRPPGAWTSTPAVLRKTLRPSISESSLKHEGSNDRLQTADHHVSPKMNIGESPKPSGSRVSTPILSSSQKQNLPQSGNSEKEYEKGLLTPAASFSKGSLSYAKTPALPGAYVVTPAARKSVTRVRFNDVDDSDSKDSITRDPLEDITNASSSFATPRTTLSPMDIPSQTRILDPSTPISPMSRRIKSQTPAGIRVLDAFGRELAKDEAKKAENGALKNGIRVVDALGREVDNDYPSQSTMEGNASEMSSPLKHGEALLRVRQGLNDLFNDLDEMDKCALSFVYRFSSLIASNRLEQNGQEPDLTRLEKLQQTSAEARVARARVSAAISSNAKDIERKLKSRQDNRKESELSLSSTVGRRRQVFRMICFFSIIQLTLVIAMYRISATRARELFLTTYYDPYYPDLHLYITKSDTLQFSMHSLSKVSWFTSLHDFHPEGWKASALQIWHNLSIIIWNWQQLLWDKSDRRIHHIIDALKTQPRAHYSEDIPLNPAAVADWCISRLESWGTSAGMETFKDDGRQGGITVVLGGKVVVVDVDFSINKSELERFEITVSSVKTSYAITGSDGTTANSDGSPLLDEFLRRCIQKFCDEVQKPEDVRDLEEATRLGVVVTQQLQYLVMLDKLAARKDDGGLQWFTGLDKLCPTLEAFAASEAEAIASSLSLVKAPLDIFLLRCHALPLPFLISPSVSFLISLSSQAYLALSRKTEASAGPWDVSLPSLRTHMFSIHKGLTFATLALTVAPTGKIFSATMNMPTFSARPTFPLAPQGSELEHSFPQRLDQSSGMAASEVLEAGKQHMWVLDFTNGGKNPGIVMSQSRMREIELIVNPLGGIDNMDPVTLMSFGTGSWVDLLFSPDAQVSSERYTTLYVRMRFWYPNIADFFASQISPSSLHPPLHLRLAAPEETGFRLEKVPVHNMKEVWGILEVVREQCWLNEILSGCVWTAEGLKSCTDKLPDEQETTEGELQAILDGTFPPRKIPVNVFLPSHKIATDALFQTPDIDGISMPQLPPRRPRIVMTSPERPPISGLVEISIIYDESRPRGITVEVNGAMGSDIQTDVLEEICRRGGTLGLAGRVWSKAA